jgi:glycerophosphoryl diester phosphodiesterase
VEAAGEAQELSTEGQVLEVDLETRKLVRKTDLVERLHALGLEAHVYTLRNDDTKYMALDFEQVGHHPIH